METSVEKRLDAILEDEVVKGFRIKEIPEDVQRRLKEEGHSLLAVRFTRLNPARRRKASEIVQRRYQKDLKDRDILSNAEVLKLVTERGEWGVDKDARRKELSDKINGLMTQLYRDGVATESHKWSQEIVAKSGAIREVIDVLPVTDAEKDEFRAVFDRWLNFTAERQAEYNEKYAAAQKREVYSHDADFGDLMEAMAMNSVEAMNLVDELDTLMRKVNRFVELSDLRAEQFELNTTYAKIFSDTVESRRDHNEELARLFVTCERLDANGQPTGQVMPTFDEIFNLPDEAITWLLEESYFFHTGIPDEARDYLATFGFMRAEGTREVPSEATTESEPSDESPAPQSSSPDSPPAVETAEKSTEP